MNGGGAHLVTINRWTKVKRMSTLWANDVSERQRIVYSVHYSEYSFWCLDVRACLDWIVITLLTTITWQLREWATWQTTIVYPFLITKHRFVKQKYYMYDVYIYTNNHFVSADNTSIWYSALYIYIYIFNPSCRLWWSRSSILNSEQSIRQ